MYDEHIKSRLIKDIRFFREIKDQNDHKVCCVFLGTWIWLLCNDRCLCWALLLHLFRDCLPLVSCFPTTSCVLLVGLRQISGTCCLILQKYCTVGFLPVAFSNAGLEAGNVASWQWACLPCPQYHKENKNTPETAKNSRTCAYEQNSVFPLSSMWVFPVWGKKALPV